MGVARTLETRGPSSREIIRTKGVRNKGKMINQGAMIALFAINENGNMLKNALLIRDYVTSTSNLAIFLDNAQP